MWFRSKWQFWNWKIDINEYRSNFLLLSQKNAKKSLGQIFFCFALLQNVAHIELSLTFYFLFKIQKLSFPWRKQADTIYVIISIQPVKKITERSHRLASPV